MTHLLGALEGGGTKFVCAVGNPQGQILNEIRFPTTTPTETLAQAIAFFKQYSLSAIGLACFGPLDLDPSSATYGSVTATPKPNWQGANLLTAFSQSFPGLPLAIDSDVNAAAIGEHTWVPQNRTLDPLVYFTIGTGIGAGIIVNGSILHGLSHPEAGHMRLPHDWQTDPFKGSCPFHGDCFEGLVSGPAITARWNKPAHLLPESSPAWPLIANYIALALVNIIMTFSPRRIILGGGVMHRLHLFPLIRQNVKDLLNNYLASPLYATDLQDFIVPPALGDRSGILGALALASAKLVTTQ